MRVHSTALKGVTSPLATPNEKCTGGEPSATMAEGLDEATPSETTVSKHSETVEARLARLQKAWGQIGKSSRRDQKLQLVQCFPPACLARQQLQKTLPSAHVTSWPHTRGQ